MDPTNYYGQVDLTQMPSVTGPLQAYQQAQIQSAQRTLASQQIQRQMQQQAIGDAAFKDAIANPSPQTYQALAIARPEVFQAAKAAHDMQDVQTQRANLQDMGALYGTLQAGQTDQANALVDKYIDAAGRAGKDTSGYQNLKTMIAADPTKARVLAGTMLSTLAGPDKFAEAYGKLGDETRAQAAEPGKEALTAAQAALATAQTDKLVNPPPQTESAGLGPDGQPIFYNRNAPPPTPQAPALSANNGALNGFVRQVIQSESGGNPTATNGASTATGAAQFLKGTWLPLMQQLHPELTQGKSDQQVLDLRNNPNLTAEATAAYAQQNAQALQGAGLPVNGATLAIAHKLGPGGAQALLNANPGAKLSQVLPADVIAANPSLANQTAGQYATNIAKTFGTTAIDTTPGDPNATGDAFLKTLPPARARMVQAIANGDMAMPPAIGRNPAQSQLLSQQVLQYDPTATAINLPVRKATQEAFTKGPQGQTINSLNTFAGHADKLNDAISQLDNTPLDWINGPAQFAGQKLGNAKTQAAVANFNTWKGLASSEIVKVLRGTGGAEADIKYWQTQLDSAKSPVALHQVVQSMAQAVQSRLDSLQNEYNTGMATLGKPVPQVMPSTKAILDRLANGGAKQAPSQQVAVNPQTGARVVLDPASGQWKPG